MKDELLVAYFKPYYFDYLIPSCGHWPQAFHSEPLLVRRMHCIIQVLWLRIDNQFLLSTLIISYTSDHEHC